MKNSDGHPPESKEGCGSCGVTNGKRKEVGMDGIRYNPCTDDGNRNSSGNTEAEGKTACSSGCCCRNRRKCLTCMALVAAVRAQGFDDGVTACKMFIILLTKHL